MQEPKEQGEEKWQHLNAKNAAKRWMKDSSTPIRMAAK
jgi:hypothetical protein